MGTESSNKKILIILIVGIILALGLASVYFLNTGGGLFQGKIEGIKAVKGTFDGKYANLEWPSVAAAKEYLILRSENSGSWNKKAQIGSSTENAYQDKSVIENKTYYYNIIGLGNRQQKVWTSKEIKISTAGVTQVLSVPKLTFDDGSSEVFSQIESISSPVSTKLKWDAVSGAVKYIVTETKENDNYKQTFVVKTTDFTRNLTSSNVSSGYKSFVYTVTAVDTNGQESAPSNSIKITPLPNFWLFFPWISETNTTNDIKIEWGWDFNSYKFPANVQVISYDLYRDGEFLKSFGPDVTNFVDEDLYTLNKIYTYKVVATLNTSGKTKIIESDTTGKAGKTILCPMYWKAERDPNIMFYCVDTGITENIDDIEYTGEHPDGEDREAPSTMGIENTDEPSAP